MNNSKGFTLSEILVAASVGMILLGSIYLAINSAQRNSTGIERKVVAQQDVRPAMELMSMEIQMASYNPNGASNIWINPATCSGAASNPAYRGIQAATANSISIEMDIDATSAVGDYTNEIIAYNYDSANQYITRETSCGGAQALLGNTLGNTRSVRVINNTLNLSLFRYYDQTGAEILPAALPAGIPNIRRIDITIAVQTEDIDPNTKQRRTMVYSTSILPRNHVL
jgi:Tfp pilus assembly protein PilV